MKGRFFMKELDLQKLQFFTEGNTFTGERDSEQGAILRYLVKPDREDHQLVAYAWHSDLCFEQAEGKVEQAFPMSEDGLEEIRRWLQEQLAN